jgi:MFS family permease
VARLSRERRRRDGRLEPLGSTPFRQLFAAQVVSTLGDNIAPIAIAFAVLDVSGSATDLGLVLAAYTLSLVVCLLLGGVWGDRVSRKRIMVGSDLWRAMAQGATAALLLTGMAHIWQLVLLQALNGAGTAFFRPSLTGAIFQLVPGEQLAPANALLSMAANVTSLLGPALAGVLVATVGPASAVAVDAGTFIASAAFLAGIVLPAQKRTTDSLLAELRDGWLEVRSRQWLWVMIAVSAIFQVLVLATWQVLGPVVSKEDLGGAGAWALIMTFFGAGAVFGGVVGLGFRPQRPMVACNLAMAVVVAPLVCLALTTDVLVLTATAAMAGGATALAGILWETTLQQRVPERAISRVTAYDWLGSTALRPAGYAAVGVVAGVAGVDATLITSAALTVLLLGSVCLHPAIRGLEPIAPTSSS